jgi:diacylglycerol O-acyltransferase
MPERAVRKGNPVTPMADEALSPVDAAWYHMDGPANPAVITALMLTRRPLAFARLRRLCSERLLGFARFRQRVVEQGLAWPTPHWQAIEPFDIGRHLHHVALPAPHDDAALRRLVADLASAPLDPHEALWQMHLVDGVGRRSAIVMRCHHCIGDGTAMMAVARALFDAEPGAPAAPRRHVPRQAEPSALQSVADAARITVDWVRHPQRAVDLALGVAGGAAVLVEELLKPADPTSPLKGEFLARQALAWSRPVPLADVKAIGAAHGAKVNDVLVAAMTGALRAYLKRRNVDVEHGTLRAMVPVDLRPPERQGQLGNEFGLVVLDLAIGSARRTQRLALTKARMDALKRSPEPMAMRFLMDVFGRGPKALEDIANTIFGSKASLVMTNVAGPRELLKLDGVPIDRLVFWVPHPGRELGMGISILSYHGEVALAVLADARLVPDPEAITTLFSREFDAMRRALNRTSEVGRN